MENWRIQACQALKLGVYETRNRESISRPLWETYRIRLRNSARRDRQLPAPAIGRLAEPFTADYIAVQPPSIVRSDPLMKAASSEAR